MGGKHRTEGTGALPSLPGTRAEHGALLTRRPQRRNAGGNEPPPSAQAKEWLWQSGVWRDHSRVLAPGAFTRFGSPERRQAPPPRAGEPVFVDGTHGCKEVRSPSRGALSMQWGGAAEWRELDRQQHLLELARTQSLDPLQPCRLSISVRGWT